MSKVPARSWTAVHLPPSSESTLACALGGGAEILFPGHRLLVALEPMPVERDENQALAWISGLAARLEGR